MTARQWISVAVSVAVLALGIAVVSRSLGGPTGQRVDLAAVGGSGDDEIDADSDAVTSTAPGESTTTAGPTTTMPPRALPLRQGPTKAGPLLGTVIVVDPGHNGRNYQYSDVQRAGSLDGDGPLCNTAGSSTNAGLDEMRINWEVGTRLSTILRGIGAEVILTHGDLDGFGPCADERGAIARDANATALISIHADGSGPGSSGFHIIYPAAKPTLDPDGVAESARLAGMVRDELMVIGGRPANYVGTNGVQERNDLANLNTANRPAILAELGNLKNGTDAAMLSDELSYLQIARALARAVVRFVGKVPDDQQLSADITGDGLLDFLPGSLQLLATTTTTSTTTTSTTTTAPTTTAAPPDPTTTVAPVDPPPTDPPPTSAG